MIAPYPPADTVRAEPVEALPCLIEMNQRKGKPFDKLRANGAGGLLAIALLASLSGCGLKPMYANGGSGSVAQSMRSISVGPIGGKAGWLVRNALNDRLANDGASNGQYRLEVELDDDISGFGVRRDDAVTRERRSLRARYRLVENATNTIVLDATAGSDAGIDVVSSEYATVAAENSALERLSQIVADQIVAKLAITLGKEQ